jgi:hypothetical protein
MMSDTQPSLKQLFTPAIALALSLSITGTALAAPGDTNSVNNGQLIQGGTYYNTATGKTTFINGKGADGLWLQSGQNVRGLEVTGGSAVTGNGGTLHFYAPGSIVRLDGNVDVSGLIRNGSYIGNGGRVYVDSAFLYQNGSIFANGFNGGAVQFNVGSAMFGPSSRVEAQGFGGLAGTIGVNASGIVDLQAGALFDASGRSINTQNLSDNVNVNVVASLVNNNGIIRANAFNLVDGHATLTAADAPLAATVTGPVPVTPAASGIDGGVIRVVATGQTRTDCLDCIADKAEAEGIFSSVEAAAIKERANVLTTNFEGNFVNTGLLEAIGGSPTTLGTTPGGNGGRMIISADNDVLNTGAIVANGGKGANNIGTDGVSILLPGAGGNGGTISITAGNSIVNNAEVSPATPGLIEANGGRGGDISTNPLSVAGAFTTNRYFRGAEPSFDGTANLTSTEQVNLSDFPIFGGRGGNGGVVALSYANTLSNGGAINANGGTGGTGLSSSVTNVIDAGKNQSVQNVTAFAVGGRGGDGGTGGLVVLSGPNNPDGAGVINVNGGTGGVGGDATARAGALAIGSRSSFVDENALSVAVAVGGQGGDGGAAGRVVTPDPATATFNYSATSGAGGEDGLATAIARTMATDSGFAQAIAQGRLGSSSDAIGSSANFENLRFATTDFSTEPSAAAFRTAYQDNTIFGVGKPEILALSQVGPVGTRMRDLASSQSVRSATLNFDDGLVYSPFGAGGPSTPPIAGSPDFGVGQSTLVVTTPAAPGANQALLQTQDNELALNGNVGVLMTRGGALDTHVGRIADATIRSVVNPLGGAAPSEPIRHWVVASNGPSVDPLVLDFPTDNSLSGLTSLTVTSQQSVTVPTLTTITTGIVGLPTSDFSSGGGHTSIVSKGDVLLEDGGALLSFGVNSGGEIALAGQNVTLTNGSGLITGANNAFHGGAITAKAVDTVYNDQFVNEDDDTVITANGDALGGTIRLQAGNIFHNDGEIAAFGGQQGGAVVVKSGSLAINSSGISADSAGQGGFVRFHGNSLAINGLDADGNPGSITTNGAQGGVIQLTAGGGPAVPGSLGDLIGNSSIINLLGIGISQGTMQPTNNISQLNFLNTSTFPLPPGAAINLGNISAQGDTVADVGKVTVAGDGLAFLDAPSTVNGVTVGTNAAAYFANPTVNGAVQLVAGAGAVKSVVCAGPTPVTPFAPGEGPVTLNVADPNPNFDPTGLLVNGRPFLLDRVPTPTNNKLVLRLGQPGLFLAKAYAPVTQEILTLAIKEYNRELSNGQTVDKAQAVTRLYLEQAGVDGDVAQQLIDAIAEGTFTAEAPVLTTLRAIAATPVVPAVTPATPVEEIRQ